jgi:glucose dehydrogenase/plastocyanin
VLAAALLALPGTASAAEQTAYAAAMNYATPTITIGQGDTLTFSNLDNLAKHDLVGHDGLFASELIGGGETSPVKGAEKLDPGQYQFHCSLHSWMQGVLNVGPPGTGPTQPDANSAQSGNPAAGATPDPYDIWPRAAKASIGNASWPFYGKDLANSRDGGKDAPSPADIPNLGIAWSFHSGTGDFTGTPIVARGMVFAGAFEGHVYAIDATTGRQRWTSHIGKPVNGTLATDGKRIYVPVAQVHHPFVQALDLKTGRTLWKAELDPQKDSDTFGSPVVWNGTVYQGLSAEYGEVSDSQVAVRGEVVALNSKNGKLRWRTYAVPPGHDGGAVWSTPAIDPVAGRLYVGTGNAYHEPAADTTDSILQLDARTGRLINHFQATPDDVWN